MNLTTAIDRFLDDRTLKRRSPATIARYRGALHAWRDWRARDATASMELTAVTLVELREYVRYLLIEHVPHSTNPRRPAVARRGLSPNAVRSARNIIRALMLFCVEFGRSCAGVARVAAAEPAAIAGDRDPGSRVLGRGHRDRVVRGSRRR